MNDYRRISENLPSDLLVFSTTKNLEKKISSVWIDLIFFQFNSCANTTSEGNQIISNRSQISSAEFTCIVRHHSSQSQWWNCGNRHLFDCWLFFLLHSHRIQKISQEKSSRKVIYAYLSRIILQRNNIDAKGVAQVFDGNHRAAVEIIRWWWKKRKKTHFLCTLNIRITR